MLLTKGIDVKTLLLFAVKEGYKDIVETLLGAENIDVNAKDFSEKTPLHLAVEEDYKDIVETLLNKGADVNVVDSNCNSLDLI